MDALPVSPRVAPEARSIDIHGQLFQMFSQSEVTEQLNLEQDEQLRAAGIQSRAFIRLRRLATGHV